MATYCENLIGSAAEGLLSKTQIKELMDELRERAKGDAYSNIKSIDERLDKAAADLISETKLDSLMAERRGNLNLIKEINLRKNYIDRFKDGARGLQAALDGVQENIKNAKFSAGALQKSVRKQLFGKLEMLLKKDDLMPTFYDQTKETELARALRGEKVEDTKVQKTADAVNSVYDDIRAMSLENGTEIQELPDFVAHHTHNPQEMLSATGNFMDDIKMRAELMLKHKNGAKVTEIMRDEARTRWKNEIIPKIDMVRTFGRELGADEAGKIFDKMYDDFISGDHFRDEPRPRGARARIPRSLTKQRKLHFKPDAWVKYNGTYGARTVQNAIVGTIDRASQDIGLMKVFGTDPRGMFDKMTSYIKSKDPYISKGALHRADLIFREVSGETKMPVNHVLAKTGQAIRSWLSMSKLGLVLPTSFNDVAIRASKMREYGVGLFEAHADAVSNSMSRLLTKEEKQIFADSLGIWADTEFGHVVRYMAGEDSPAGTMTKAMQQFFNLTGMTGWDKFHEMGTSSAISRVLALNRMKAFEKLEPTMQRNLRMYGIESKEWDLIRHKDNVMSAYSNKKFIAPDAVKYFSDDSVKAYLGNDKAETWQIEDAKKNIEDRIRTFFIDQTGEALIRPSASDRAYIIRGTRPGTVMGELARSFGQFKYFSIAMSRRVGARMMMGLEEGAEIPWWDPRGRSALGLAEFMVAGTILGYVGNSVKDIAHGYTPQTPDNPEAWVRAFDIGATGILGQYLFNDYQRYGTSFTGALAGPVFGTMDDVVKLAYKIVARDKPGIAAVDLIEKNTPFLNLWGAKTALDYLYLDNVKNRLSPGYKRRLKKRLQEHRQSSLLY